MKEPVSTLSGIYQGRRTGNTTQQTDSAIQILFGGDIVKVEDNYHHGTSEHANKYLFDRILQRLSNEHSLSSMIADKKIRINKNKLEIELIS